MSASDPDSRLLLIMRHGKAESGGGQPDQERTLVEKGWAQARLVGEYLESQGVRPTRVLVSDAERTRETWEGVQASMPGFDGKVTFHEEIYSGGTGEVLELIRDVKAKHAVVLVVGHEPTMAHLVTGLADDDSDPSSAAQARIGMPTGGTAVLSGVLPTWAELGEESLTLHTIVRP